MTDRAYTNRHMKSAMKILFPNDKDRNTWDEFLSGALDEEKLSGPKTEIQGGLTVLQTEPISKKPAGHMTVHDSGNYGDAFDGIYNGNATAEASASQLSKLIVGDRGTGLTTFVMTMLYWLMKNKPCIAVRVVSTEIVSFMGLEANDQVVTYVSGDMEKIIPPVASVVSDVYEVYEKRCKASMDALLSGSQPPKWESWILIIDNWSLVYGALKGVSYKEDKKRLRSSETLRRINVLVRQADKFGITVLLTSNSHRQEHIGLDYTVLRSMALVGLGGVRSGQTGGMMALKDLITDKKILPVSTQSQLLKAFSQGNKQKLPLMAVLNQGEPRIDLLKDYSSVASKKLQYAGSFAEIGAA